jgi:hypothetical protein
MSLERYRQAAGTILHLATRRPLVRSAPLRPSDDARRQVDGLLYEMDDLRDQAMREAVRLGQPVLEVGSLLDRVRSACEDLWTASCQGWNLPDYVAVAADATDRLADLLTAAGGADGPDPVGQQFRWQGNTTSLQPIPWQLLHVMWGRKSIAEEDDALEQVWGHAPSEDAITHAVKAVNRALAKCGYPRFLGTRNGRLRWRD